MKPKTAFESGNSPPKVSESGATIQTGRGLEETKRRIEEAFDKIRQHPVQHSEPTPLQYTRDQEARFHQKAKRLSLAALETSHISKRPRRDVVCWEITIPSETASDLIAQALERWGEMSEPKVGPSDFQKEVERLKAAGQMPSLERLLEVIGDPAHSSSFKGIR